MLAEFAADRHGVVSRRELLQLGIGRGAIDHRVATGRLAELQRGVYAVGGAPRTRDSARREALLAAGPGAVLSHRSAALLWEIVALAPDRVEVTAPGRRNRPGIEIHRSPLSGRERTTWKGFPLTTPSRTLLDLAATLSPPRLRRAVEQAEVQRRLDVDELRALLDLHRRRAGVAGLRTVLEDHGLLDDDVVVRSVFEAEFAAFLTEHGLPRPRVNAVPALPDRRIEVDFAWPASRVVVELDGHATHGTRSGFERDRERDRALLVAGWRVMRVTWRQFHQCRDEIERDLRALLASG